MKTDTNCSIPTAALAMLLALCLLSAAHAQQAASAPETTPNEEKDQDEVVKMEAVTVTTGYRSPKAIEQIPGAIRIITLEEIGKTQLMTEDATQVLARTIPGYNAATQALQNTGETLRGRVALRLFDGISQNTPLREGSRSATFTDMDVVAQIEVINGPSASEGIGAVGGIINYISKSPTKEGAEATLRTKFTGQGYDDSTGYKVGLNYAVKKGKNDLIFATSYLKRGMFWDANGRRQGQTGSGTSSDSDQRNLFIKAGRNFGEANQHRLALTFSKFRIEGRGNYIEDPVSFPTTSSIRGTPPGGKTVFNDFTQYVLAYGNNALLGGNLNIIGYKADQAMRFVVSRAAPGSLATWDPKFGPIEGFFDQSEINSQKKGLRSNWLRKNLLGLEGLEVNVGFDYLEETAQQRLALTNRTWVPPMNYTSKAPFIQASYARGPVTVSAGVRHEDGQLQVDDYTTVYFANNTFVRGGTLPYTETIPNAGVIARLPRGWSAFGSYSKGFTLPNVGIPLRNVSTPGQSVQGIVDLQAVISDNKEVGLTWQGKRGSFSASYYHSFSDLGSSITTVLLGTPPNQTLDFILRRQPVDIKGYDFNGELKLTKTLKLTAVYTHIKGMTSTSPNGPLNFKLGTDNISPDKINLGATWKFMPRASVTLDVDTLRPRTADEGSTTGLTLFHLTASYSTKEWGDFGLGIENLTDKFYLLPWSQALGGRFAGRGRVISVTHTIKF